LLEEMNGSKGAPRWRRFAICAYLKRQKHFLYYSKAFACLARVTNTHQPGEAFSCLIGLHITGIKFPVLPNPALQMPGDGQAVDRQWEGV